MEKIIYKREIIDEIEKYLGTDNIIVLHGSRQVGKTYILYYIQRQLEHKGETTYYLDLEDTRILEVLNAGIDSVLSFLKGEGIDLDHIKEKGKKLFLCIDEIQYVDNPSPLLKIFHDHHTYIQIILSGSSSFSIKSKFSDSLVGRTINFEIYPLCFKEFLKFKKIPESILESTNFLHTQELKKFYTEYVLYGGYPKIVLENTIEFKETYLQQIIDTYIRKDIRDLAHVKDIHKFNTLLKILATYSGQLLNVSELSKACAISKPTIENYLFILENTYIIKLVSPYSTSAKVEVIKAPKIFFYDTGIMQMLWFKQLGKEIMGSVFETAIFTDLTKKYGTQNIFYWRTKNGQEIDFVLNIKNNLLPIEVKMSFNNFKDLCISYFCDKYRCLDYKVVALKFEKKDTHSMFPWEI